MKVGHRKPIEDTKQFGIRVEPSVMHRLEEIAKTHPMMPTKSQLIRMILREWLDREEGETG